MGEPLILVGTLEGKLSKGNLIIKKGGTTEQEWVLELSDGTQVLLGKRNLNEFNLERLNDRIVNIKGKIIWGNIDICEDDFGFQSRTYYKISVEDIREAHVKSTIIREPLHKF